MRILSYFRLKQNFLTLKNDWTGRNKHVMNKGHVSVFQDLAKDMNPIIFLQVVLSSSSSSYYWLNVSTYFYLFLSHCSLNSSIVIIWMIFFYHVWMSWSENPQTKCSFKSLSHLYFLYETVKSRGSIFTIKMQYELHIISSVAYKM